MLQIQDMLWLYHISYIIYLSITDLYGSAWHSSHESSRIGKLIQLLACFFELLFLSRTAYKCHVLLKHLHLRWTILSDREDVACYCLYTFELYLNLVWHYFSWTLPTPPPPKNLIWYHFVSLYSHRMVYCIFLLNTEISIFRIKIADTKHCFSAILRGRNLLKILVEQCQLNLKWFLTKLTIETHQCNVAGMRLHQRRCCNNRLWK